MNFKACKKPPLRKQVVLPHELSEERVGSAPLQAEEISKFNIIFLS